MAILEKAYAKFNVFHGNIDGGDPLEAVAQLTNMPAQSYSTNEQTVEELFGIIHQADSKKWFMAGSCTTPMEGLTSGHAYTILDALLLTDNYGQQWNLIKMRNPWGSEGYNGPWSDKDHARWTDQLKAEVGHTHADDGIFLLPVDIFYKAFKYYKVAMYEEQWENNWETQAWAKTAAD